MKLSFKLATLKQQKQAKATEPRSGDRNGGIFALLR
jgi:hypothetical protein